MKLGGDLLGGGDSPNDTHGPVATVADGDADEEDASEELHPGESTRSGGAKLGLEHRGDGGKLQRAMGHEEGEPRGLGSFMGLGERCWSAWHRGPQERRSRGRCGYGAAEPRRTAER